MNVVLQDEVKTSKKQWLAYSIIIAICIIAIIVAFYVQFYGRIDLFGTKETGDFGKKSEDSVEELREGFGQIFTNEIKNEGSEYSIKKEITEQPLVYTKYSQQEDKANSYNIDVTIPYINIKNEIVQSYNEEIEKTFVNKGREILLNNVQNSIYQVSYTSTVQEGILSLIVQATIKEGANAQRLIMRTYNYDLRNNKAITLAEVLKIKKLEEKFVQDEINKKIEEEHKKAQDLNAIGYTVFDRDVKSEIYKIENTRDFYLTDGVLYIVYPYGNDKMTNEIDIVVI